ncbi:MAG: hypothetical protein JW957_04300 [Candidatus Omnitrophica bacterium]|nr:hypothetical protein [Candidatus Omnitrophota bacterium]
MNNKGYLLPITAILIVIMVIIGLGILYLGGLERIGAGRRLNREKAFYLAEAGAYRAYAHLADDITWDPEETPVYMGDGSFSVVLEEEDEDINVISTGTVNNISETVKLTLGYGGGGGIFSHGIFGSIRVTIWNNGFVDSYNSALGPYGGSNMGNDGDVRSNNSVMVYNNGIVRGDASVSTGEPADIYDPSNGITGNKNYTAPEIELPQIDVPDDLEVLPYPVHGDSRIQPSGNYTLSGGNLQVNNNNSITISGGSYRLKNIELNNNSSVIVTGNVRLYIEQVFKMNNNTTFTFNGVSEIYIGSKIILSNGSDINSPPSASNLAIYILSNETQSIENNSVTIVGVIYAPNGKIVVSNNAQIYGDIVANEIVVSNNGMVHYDTALRTQHPPGEPGVSDAELTIFRWTKPGWASRFE